MDIFTYDPLTFQQDALCEDFKTVIWTDRYNTEGIVEITANDTPQNRLLFAEGNFLGTPGSAEVMLLETQQASEGTLNVKGYSLLGFLRNRMVRNTYLNANKSWTFGANSPGNAAGWVIRQMCIAGNLMTSGSVLASAIGAAEVIPNLRLQAVAPGSPITVTVEYGDVYSAVVQICQNYALGQKLYLSQLTETTYELLYESYYGQDRTSGQTINPVVRFEPATDSLTGLVELRSISNYKNVAHAWAPSVTSTSYRVGTAYVDGGDLKRGFARRTMYVPVDDVSDEDIAGGTQAQIDARLDAILVQKAKDALAMNNYVKMVDGTIVPQSEYVYGQHFGMGDIIELRANSGIASKAMITEYVRTSDESGDKSYPTLSVISE